MTREFLEIILNSLITAKKTYEGDISAIECPFGYSPYSTEESANEAIALIQAKLDNTLKSIKLVKTQLEVTE